MTNKSPYASELRMDCKFISEDFEPNGDLLKKIWSTGSWVMFDHDVYSAITYPEAETWVAALWSNRNVYFGFRCKYSALNIFEDGDPTKERWELWKRDVVEVFINPDPDHIAHYFEFEVAPNNLWIDLEIDKTKEPFCDPTWASGFRHATRIDRTSHRWTCEMQIPLTSMGVTEIFSGTEWRLNCFRADGLGDNSQRRLLSWSAIPGGDTFHTPTCFGLIRFI